MDYKDYYAVMGVSPDADAKEIKTAYRRLARKYHPDISKEANAEAKFKELGEAYEVLKDPEKRKTYDQYARDWKSGQQSQSSAHGFSWDDNSPDNHYSYDFFENLFGGSPHFQQKSKVGANLQADITISLEDAYHGAVKELRLQGKPHALQVKIPLGVKSGQKIRLSGQGESGAGGNGDLYLTVHLQKHPLYDVIDNDIHLTLPLTPWEAALGATVVVPTLAGNVDLKIPAGSQSGQLLRLKKRGLPGKVPGDQLVRLKIVIPQATTAFAKELYQKMAEEMPFNPRETMGAK